MSKIRIAGLDGSLTAFGGALMTLDLDTMELELDRLFLVETKSEKKAKNVRASSDNLRRSEEIATIIRTDLKNHRPAAIFCEVPSGGQDYNSVLGFGIVIGTYASLEGVTGVRPTEVSPAETKIAAIGDKRAGKDEIMDWAWEKYPAGNWATYKRNGKVLLSQKNEHMADSVAICHAGIQTASFQSTLAILRAHQAAA